MTILTTQGVVDRREFTNWFHVFQTINATWRTDPRLVVGNFFLGLPGYNQATFAGADIPPGSTILSATADYTTERSGLNGAIEVLLNTPTRGPAQATEPWATPLGHFGWRRDFWGAWKIDLRNAGMAIIAESPPGAAAANTSWRLWFEDATAIDLEPGENVAMRQRLGTLMTPIVAAGGQVLVNCFATLSRQGNLPAFTVFHVDIYTAENVNGIREPVTLLASSDPRLVTTITVPTQYLMTFSGADQITLPAGVDVFAVARIQPEPATVDPSNGINIHNRRAFLQALEMSHLGAGVGGDWGNHPGAVDAAFGTTSFSLGTNIVWNPGFPGVGGVETTPDITDLVQVQVDDPAYLEESKNGSGGRLLTISQFFVGIGAAGQNRNWGSFNSATVDPPLINITYDDSTRTDLDADKLADPYVGPARFREPFDRGYYLWKYGPPQALLDAQEARAPQLYDDAVEELEHGVTDTAEDIFELQEYIREITAGLESNLIELDLEAKAQVAMIERLEQNVGQAREVLLLALETRRQQQNELAAIEAIIQMYY